MFRKIFFAQASQSKHDGLVLVPHAEEIMSGELAQNNGKSCGYVAAALLATYWSKRLGFRVYPGAEMTADAIHDYLLQDTPNATSWAYSIVKRWRRYGFHPHIAWRLGWFSVYRELRAGRPVILFGGLANPTNPEQAYINHAVLAYGYQIIKGRRVLLTHYGWAHHTAVLMKTPFQGSAVFYRPK